MARVVQKRAEVSVALSALVSIHKNRPTLVGADAHPCAFNYRVLPAKVSVVQAGLVSHGGWARLNLAVGRQIAESIAVE